MEDVVGWLLEGPSWVRHRALVDLAHESGWPCCVSPELGTFRGPGRKDDPFP